MITRPAADDPRVAGPGHAPAAWHADSGKRQDNASSLTLKKVSQRLTAMLTGTTLVAVVLTAFTGAARANAQALPLAGPSPTSWYLALGDSVAARYQPGIGDDPQGGYSGHVLQALRASAPQAELRNLACDGETSTTFVAGGKCSYEEGSQLAQALVFLRAHSSTTRLITITLGGNDLAPCLPQADPATCAQTALGS